MEKKISFTKDMNLYRKSDGICTKATRTNKQFCKIAACKISLQKSIVFLYISNKKLESEIKNSNMYNSIKNKVLRNKFDKRYERPPLKTTKKLLREIRKDLNI